MSVNSKDQTNVDAYTNTGLAMICKGLINGVHTDMLIDTKSVDTMVHYGLHRDISDTIASL
jgi:hypothetical protein